MIKARRRVQRVSNSAAAESVLLLLQTTIGCGRTAASASVRAIQATLDAPTDEARRRAFRLQLMGNQSGNDPYHVDGEF